MEIKFYKCNKCGTIVDKILDNSDSLTCCDEKMQELIPNTVDAAQEKHVPVYERSEDEVVVRVGEVEHPMEKDHYIMWIAQVSDNQTTRIRLYPEQGTEVRFKYIPQSTLYAYCNKHGLWKKEVE
jgi:superoxide reductase